MKFALALLLVLPCSFALELSEIMPDPDGTDFGKEWIELVGDENLSGCTVSDAHSTDALELLQEGEGEIILIVESDHALALPEDITIYGAGKAIGNGLGNAQDSILIACNGTLINVSYDTAAVEGYAAGRSLLFETGAWRAGPQNGTMGTIVEDVREIPPEEPPAKEAGGGREEICNNTLVITVSATQIVAGEQVQFTILSAGYATWEAALDEEPIASGTILSSREHAIAPQEEGTLKLRAFASECRGDQRAVRTIDVLPSPRTAPTLVEQEIANLEEQAPRPANQERENETLPERVTSPPARPPEDMVTGKVVYDENRSAVPWIASFGIVTLLVSAGLFWYVSRNEA